MELCPRDEDSTACSILVDPFSHGSPILQAITSAGGNPHTSRPSERSRGLGFKLAGRRCGQGTALWYESTTRNLRVQVQAGRSELVYKTKATPYLQVERFFKHDLLKLIDRWIKK